MFGCIDFCHIRCISRNPCIRTYNMFCMFEFIGIRKYTFVTGFYDCHFYEIQCPVRFSCYTDGIFSCLQFYVAEGYCEQHAVASVVGSFRDQAAVYGICICHVFVFRNILHNNLCRFFLCLYSFLFDSFRLSFRFCRFGSFFLYITGFPFLNRFCIRFLHVSFLDSFLILHFCCRLFFLYHTLCCGASCGNSQRNISGIRSFQCHQDFYGIITALVHVHLIFQVVTGSCCIGQFVDPAEFCKASYFFSLGKSKVRIGFGIGHIRHLGICLRFSAASCVTVGSCCQVIEFCFFIDRYCFCGGFSGIISTAYVVTADVHIQTIRTEEQFCCFLCQFVAVTDPVCPPAKGSSPSFEFTKTISVGVIEGRRFCRFQFDCAVYTGCSRNDLYTV